MICCADPGRFDRALVHEYDPSDVHVRVLRRSEHDAEGIVELPSDGDVKWEAVRADSRWRIQVPAGGGAVDHIELVRFELASIREALEVTSGASDGGCCISSRESR